VADVGVRVEEDEILITGPTTGVMELSIAEIRVDRENVETASKGQNFSIPVPGMIRRSDKLYKVVDASQVKQQ